MRARPGERPEPSPEPAAGPEGAGMLAADPLAALPAVPKLAHHPEQRAGRMRGRQVHHPPAEGPSPEHH